MLLRHDIAVLGRAYQSVCWSSITSRILALPPPPALSAASEKVAAAAAVVCFTALEMEEKKPAPEDWLAGGRLS